MSEKSASTVPALDKAVRILDLLAREATPLSGAEIAKLLDLPRSSVHGLIGSL
ncbi:MAG: helix-turn-helix domain-containing protein, partial [Neisseria sp.]|nr:helix-turn-helix domain-containing protein [Neisseria sp.]